MDSDLVISIATRRLPEAGDDYAPRKEGENEKRKYQSGMDSDLDSGPAAISDDAAGFRGVSTWSWESMAPCLAVIPGIKSTNKDELLFVSHDGKHHMPMPMPMPCSNIDLRFSVVNNKDGWIILLLEDGVVVLFNPVTGAQQQPFTPIHNYLEDIDFVFLNTDTDTDTMIAIAAHDTGNGGVILAIATAGDDGWYVKEFPSKYKFFGITDIVFHDADRKFYAMDREGKLLAFSLFRCDGNKTTAVTKFSFLSNGREHSWRWRCRLHLVSVGSNLYQVSSDFDISKYCPEANTWIEMTPTNNIDFGNNTLFVDHYGARLVPLPQGEGGVEERKLRRNCIYFIYHEKIPCPQEDIDKKKYQVELERVKIEEEAGNLYVPNFGHCGDEEEEIECLFDTRAKIYDVSKGTLEPYFSTDIQSYYEFLPQVMWFMPSLPVNN